MLWRLHPESLEPLYLLAEFGQRPAPDELRAQAGRTAAAELSGAVTAHAHAVDHAIAAERACLREVCGGARCWRSALRDAPRGLAHDCPRRNATAAMASAMAAHRSHH